MGAVFLNKVTSYGQKSYSKSDSSTGVFLSNILKRFFTEHLRTTTSLHTYSGCGSSTINFNHKNILFYIFFHKFLCWGINSIKGASCGRWGGLLPCDCWKTEKKRTDFRKNVLIASIYGLNLSFKILKSILEKIFFPATLPYFHVLWMNCLSKCP